jgi:hypothetical protein
MKDGYVLLGSYTATSTGTSNVFSNIPSGYESLVVRGQAMTGQNLFMATAVHRINGNTGMIYDSWNYYNPATAAVIHDVTNTNAGNTARMGGAYLGNWFSHFETTFFGSGDSTSYTKWITVFGMSGGNGGYGAAGVMGGVWADTAVVTQLDMLGSWYAGSTLALYGRRT